MVHPPGRGRRRIPCGGARSRRRARDAGQDARGFDGDELRLYQLSLDRLLRLLRLDRLDRLDRLLLVELDGLLAERRAHAYDHGADRRLGGDRGMTSGAMRSLRALGTTAFVAVTDHRRIDESQILLDEELQAIDEACSRFRPDSEIRAVNEAEGRAVRVSPRLFEALSVARRVAANTDGAVDPTVGRAVEETGYDVSFEAIRDEPDQPPGEAVPAPGWWRLELDPSTLTVRVPAGTRLDLGASAKALAADKAASKIFEKSGCGVLVSIGGDISVAGPPPDEGWSVGIAVDSSTEPDRAAQAVAITSGGLASSSTTVRAWRRGGHRLHHIVDPATGECAPDYWTLATAVGPSCVEANALSTAAIVWAARARERLSAMRVPARLVRKDGTVFLVGGWPRPSVADRVGALQGEI